MKKYLLMIALVAVSLVSCSKAAKEDEAVDEEIIKVSLEVTGIADNQATVTVTLEEGSFHGAKLVEAANLGVTSVDYGTEVKLINFVKENGIDIDLPYTNTLTGLTTDLEMLTAVIVYDSDGRVATSDCVAYQVWTSQGEVYGWSSENSPGNLDEIVWPEDEDSGEEIPDEPAGPILPDPGGNAGNIDEIVWPEDGDGGTVEPEEPEPEEPEPEEPEEPEDSALNFGGSAGSLGEITWPEDEDSGGGSTGGDDSGDDSGNDSGDSSDSGGGNAGNLGEIIWPDD